MLTDRSEPARSESPSLDIELGQRLTFGKILSGRLIEATTTQMLQYTQDASVHRQLLQKCNIKQGRIKEKSPRRLGPLRVLTLHLIIFQVDEARMDSFAVSSITCNGEET